MVAEGVTDGGDAPADERPGVTGLGADPVDEPAGRHHAEVIMKGRPDNGRADAKKGQVMKDIDEQVP